MSNILDLFKINLIRRLIFWSTPKAFLNCKLYKLTFIKPHLDHGDVIYDRAFNESFHQRFESIQYNVAVAIRRAITGTLLKKLF